MTADTDADTDGRAALRDEVAALRRELHADDAVPDRLLVLSDLVDALADLCERWPGEAASVLADVDAVYAHAGQIAAESADSIDDYVLALCVLAEICLLRDGASDLDEAIEAMGAVLDVLPADDDGRAEIELELGAALCRRAARSQWGVADVTGAIDLLATAQRRLPTDDTRRLSLAPWLAVLLASLFGSLGGAPSDRELAIAQANEYLAWPQADEGGTAACRLVLAWMSLCRRYTRAQRSGSLLLPDPGAALAAAPDLSARLARLGAADISIADAESAIAQLRQIDDPALLDDLLPASVPVIWGIAILVLVAAGREATDLERVVAELGRVAGLIPEDAAGRAEMLALQAILLAAHAETPGGSAQTPAASEAVLAAAAALPAEHPLRSPLLQQLGNTLRRQTTAGRSSDGVAA